MNTKASDFLMVSHWLKKTRALGPGERCVVWLQGCQKRCKGCMTPEAQALEGGQRFNIDLLLEELLSEPVLQGITISGGEPFLQPEGLSEFLRKLKLMREDLNVIIYSGYYYWELKEMGNQSIHAVLEQYCDLLIDGPYIEEMNDDLGMRGSSNQSVHALTEKGRKMQLETRRNTELHFDEERILLVGVPSKQNLKMIQNVYRVGAAE